MKFASRLHLAIVVGLKEALGDRPIGSVAVSLAVFLRQNRERIGRFASKRRLPATGAKGL